jgi:hypothetical protein
VCNGKELDMELPEDRTIAATSPCMTLYVFGMEHSSVRDINLPAGVEKYRLKFRDNDFAILYLKYKDRIEKCSVGYSNGFLYPSHTIAVNHNG